MEGGFDGGGGGASVYSEAKGEYTKQLTQFVVPAFHRFFMGCLQQAATEEPQVKRQLWKFQEILSQIPEWNMDKVQREVGRLVAEIQCDYLEELVTAVFIAHTKILTAIRIGNKNKRVQITIPKLEHFLHRALSECSRLLWSSAYLFNTELSAIDKQKNHRQIEQLLHDGIAHAIRGLLPVKNILKDYLAEPEDEADDEADDDAEETITPKVSAVAVSAAATPVATAVVQQPVVSEPASEPAVEQIESNIISEIASPTNTPLEETAQIPLIALEEQKPVITEAPAPTPVPEPAPVQPVVPTIVVDTEPVVRFTSHDQVIQQRGNETNIQYVEKNRELDDEDAFEFVDGDGESLSDYEDLDGGSDDDSSLSDDDFETLG
jgi:hypothetical protein